MAKQEVQKMGYPKSFDVLKQEVQLVQCVKVRTVEVVSRKGEVSTKEVYSLNLDGWVFEEWERFDFKAVLNRYYYPMLKGYPQAYTGKDGKARVRNSVSISWLDAIDAGLLQG